MTQNSLNEDVEIKKVKGIIEDLQFQIDLEEKIIAELDQQLAESKRTCLGLKHDMEVAKREMVGLRMIPITVGS